MSEFIRDCNDYRSYNGDAVIHESVKSDTIPSIESSMAYQWYCDNCHNINTTSHNHFDVYGRIVECRHCERCYKLNLPWEK
jgi:hypothetical protein